MRNWALSFAVALACALIPLRDNAEDKHPPAVRGPVQAAPKGFLFLDLRIPMESAGPRGLQALLVRADEPGPHPLAIITHGTNYSEQVRRQRSPHSQLPLAMEFARRGWTAVIVLRRGNGDSGGEFQEGVGICQRQTYEKIGTASADDLRTAIDFLAKRPDVDPNRIIALGVSGGGFAAVALTADPPPGLIAAINFAGGSSPYRNLPACTDNLVAAFRSFGVKSRVPMLWVYSVNDAVFWPEVAQRFYAAFSDAGGKARFIQAPAFEENGHNLFGARGAPIWTVYVDEFLKSRNLQLRTRLLPLPSPVASPVHPPSELPQAEMPYFQQYLAAQNQKALAISASGNARYAYGFAAAADAKKSALALCQAHGEKCRIVFVNNSFVRP
jgi:dienelactone hydrolase